MFEKFKIISLADFGYDEPVKIKRLTAKEQADLTNELARLTNAKIAGKNLSTDLQPGMFNIIYVEKIVSEGPIPANRDKIGELDWEVVSYLAEEGQKFNAPLVMQSSEDG